MIHIPLIVTVGYDRDNPVQLKDNGDGTWTDLYNEVLLDDAYVFRHFSSALEDAVLHNPEGAYRP